MASLLYKTDSGTDKQVIQPKKWTYVRFAKRSVFRVSRNGTYHWAVILRIEYPTTGSPNVVRGRFVRYPNTSKIDETGHDDKNTYGFNGQTLHSHWSHFLTVNRTMPMGFWIWHNGSKPITLDGRQIKATT